MKLCRTFVRCIHLSDVSRLAYHIRVPKKVFPNEAEAEVATKQSRPSYRERRKSQVQQYFDHLAEREKEIFGEYSRSDSFVVQYRKLKDGDEKFISQAIQTKLKSNREKSGKIWLEGRRLIDDALRARLKLHKIYFMDPNLLENLPLRPGEGEFYQISKNRVYTWSEVQTPQGIFAVVEKPNLSTAVPKSGSTDEIPLTVIADQIRDPGNMGSILRASAAAGARKILLPKGCVDVWDQKVLRTGMGAHFRVPIHTNLLWADMGNYLPSCSRVFVAESKPAEVDENSPLEILPYYEVEFFGQNAVENILILGGEAEGISSEAKEFCRRCEGSAITIPMANGVESLNTAAAVSVLMFEIRKQYLKLLKSLE